MDEAPSPILTYLSPSEPESLEERGDHFLGSVPTTSGTSNGGRRHPKIHPYLCPSVYHLVLLDLYVHSPSS